MRSPPSSLAIVSQVATSRFGSFDSKRRLTSIARVASALDDSAVIIALVVTLSEIGPIWTMNQQARSLKLLFVHVGHWRQILLSLT